MNRCFLFFLSLVALPLFSCKNDAERAEHYPLTIRFEQAQSKVDALGRGDAVGVFLWVDGQGACALANRRFESDGSGVLAGVPLAYYPEVNQASTICAYYPYQDQQTNPAAVGYSLPADQTDPTQARAADLLWGTVSTTPSRAAVQMAFDHLFSKLTVEVPSQTVEAISVHGVRATGTLEVRTGVFSLGTTRQSVQGVSEVILPAQSISALEVTVGGTNYSFQPSTAIALAAATNHTLTLTLNQAAHTAELLGVSAEEWTTDQGAGGVQHSVRNDITVHWLLPNPDFAQATGVVLHLLDLSSGKKIDVASTTYTHDPSSTHNVGQSTFAIASDELTYPFRVESIDFRRADGSVIQSCPTLVAQGIYRSGAVSFGIYQDNILLVTSEPIVAWDQSVVVGGIDNIKYKGNDFRLRIIEPDFDYTAVAKVRMSIWGGVSEWSIAAPTVMSGVSGFVVESQKFSFPDHNGYAPATRHYTIEWVELVDAAGNYLYKGYCNWVVSEEGDVTMLLYSKGAVYSPSSVVRLIDQSIKGELDNMRFANNTLRFRFVNPDFIDDSRPKIHTIRMGVFGDVYTWSGVSLDPSSSFFTAWTDLSFPDQNGYRPTSQAYRILWVEVLDASGGFLYKSYCNVDVTRPGLVTLDLHQRGVLSNPTSVAPPDTESGEINPPTSTKYVANTFTIRLFEPTFDYWTSRTVKLTCSDGKVYTWSQGIGWNSTTNYAICSPSWSGTQRPAAYPFTIQKIEFFNNSSGLLLSRTVSVEVSYPGTVLITLLAK